MNPWVILVGLFSLTVFSSLPLAAGDDFVAVDAELLDRAVVMQVPEGVRRVRVRIINNEGIWETCAIAHLKGSEGYLKLRLPDGALEENIEITASWSDPFPFEFYEGKSDFDATRADGSALRTNTPGQESFDVTTAESTVEESDIWKWRDSVLYFFNQYRGLQVIDVSDPAAPTRLASMRIAFSGEQLYLHPSEDVVVLLTYDSSASNGQVLLVEHTESDELVEQGTLPVPGYIVESRMIGNILYVVSKQWWQESILDPDTGVEHFNWESGLTVSKIDLTNPASPVIADPLDLKSGEYDYWGAQVQATSDALLVSTNAYDSARRQSNSTVHVVDISNPLADPIVSRQVPVNGQVLNKFNMQLKGDILTIVSQVWRWGENRQRYASIETFDLSAPSEDPLEYLGRLEFANNESITASRFAGELLYVVTVLQIDPLFVISLADPANPQLLGELEVPGFSTHLETLGEEAVISVGIERPQIAVSWFDVSDLAEPTLASRVFVGAEDGWSWTEANWDEKAFGFFPDDNLILLPYQGSVPEIGWKSGVQIIEIGEGELIKRGSIEHDFPARRARVLNGAVVSISGRSLKSLDISDPDNPVLLADLTLAWPVDYVHRVGEFLVQLERSPSYWYYGSNDNISRLHVSPIGDTDERVAKLDLPVGRIVGSALLDDCLILAQSHAESIQNEEGISRRTDSFTTTVIGLDDPENPVILGTTSNTRSVDDYYYGYSSSYQGELLPDGSLVWFPAERESYYFLDYGIGVGDRIAGDISYPYYLSAGRIYTVAIGDKSQPLILSCSNLLDGGDRDNTLANLWPEGTIRRLGSTLYFGLQSSELIEREDLPSQWMAQHWLGQLDLTNPADPKQRDLVEIPGIFENAIGNQSDGVILFSSSIDSIIEGEKWRTESRIQALAFDGLRAFLVDELMDANYSYGPKLFADRFIVLSETDYTRESPITGLTTYEWLSSGTFLQRHTQQHPGAIYRLGVIDDLLVAPGSRDISFIDFRDPADPARTTLSFPNLSFWQSINTIDIFERESAYLPLGWNGVQSLNFEGAFSFAETLGQIQAQADEAPEWISVSLDSLIMTSAEDDWVLGELAEDELWRYAESVQQFSYDDWTRHGLNLDPEAPLPLSDEDSDGDGLSNGWEYISGSDPGNRGDALPVEFWISTESNGERYVYFRLRINPHTNQTINLVPQYSNDLKIWVSFSGLFEVSDEQFNTAQLARYREPLGVQDILFFRLLLTSDN